MKISKHFLSAVFVLMALSLHGSQHEGQVLKELEARRKVRLEAIRDGNLTKAEQLIKEDHEIVPSDWNRAFSYNQLDMVKLFIRIIKAEPEIYGELATHFKIDNVGFRLCETRPEILKFLIDHGFDINATGNDGALLHSVVGWLSTHRVKMLLDLKADPLVQHPKTGQTPLQLAYSIQQGVRKRTLSEPECEQKIIDMLTAAEAKRAAETGPVQELQALTLLDS